MRILLTGGTGLIGSEIAKKLAARGDELILLIRNLESSTGKLPFPAKCFQWTHEAEVPPAALEGVEAVINLAGEPLANGRWTDEKKKLIRESRIEGTRKLVRALRQHLPPVKVFVQGSAIGFYGDRGDEVLDGTSGKGSGFLADLVEEWEAEARNLNRDLPSHLPPIRLPVVRTSMVLSRHGGALEQMLPLYRASLAGRIGLDGAQWMSWIHLEDIARLFVHAIDSQSADAILEGVAPEPVTNRTFTDVLCRELDVIESIAVPSAALKVLYGEMASVILNGQRVVPTRTIASGFKFDYPSIEEALGEILKPLRGSTFEELSEQWIPKSPQEIWPYFTDEKNLETLTPKSLQLKVKAKSTPILGQGTLIDSTMRLNGISFGWRTRIDEWQPESKFVDSQLRGPYAHWHHTHEFIPMAGGTLLRDRIRYRVPFGWLGAIASGWKVHKDVAMIFDFRRKKIAEIFSN